MELEFQRCLDKRRHLFVARGILDDALIDDLDDARTLREDADYRAEFSQGSAEHSVKAARRLIARISELLAGWDDRTGRLDGETQ